MKRENFQLTPHFSYYEMTRSAWAEAASCPRSSLNCTPRARAAACAATATTNCIAAAPSASGSKSKNSCYL